MTIDTLSVPYPRRAFEEYRAAVAKTHSAEDEALRRAYSALTRGQKVLDLPGVMKKAGVDAHGRPRLAIAPAHWTQVECRVFNQGGTRFTKPGEMFRRHRKRVILPADTFPRGTVVDGTARVPLIPPRFRPEAVHRYYLLWEADWLAVPTDPFLLRHLAGPFYAVLAQWDLTPLERAVLAGRP